MIDTSIYDARKAQAERERQQRIERARQKRALGAPPPGTKHGVSAYANYGCRCTICRAGRREWNRRHRGIQPSLLADEVARLTAELDAQELNLEALREENAMLHCRLQELEPHPHHNPELVNGYPPRNITGP